jgi:hypothetical protein
MPKLPSREDMFEAFYSTPFVPSNVSGNGIDIDAQLRIAHALEYIAAQLGEINRRQASREDDDGA